MREGRCTCRNKLKQRLLKGKNAVEEETEKITWDKAKKLGIYPKGTGEPQKVVEQGRTWSDLCFRRTTLRMHGGGGLLRQKAGSEA